MHQAKVSTTSGAHLVETASDCGTSAVAQHYSLSGTHYRLAYAYLCWFPETGGAAATELSPPTHRRCSRGWCGRSVDFSRK